MVPSLPPPLPPPFPLCSPPLPKIKYNQASVQICTISGIHYWGKCKNLYFLLMVKVEQICTLGIECTNLYTWGWVYKFVHSWLGERCTNLYTHASFHSDIHKIVTNCVKYYPNSKNNACMLNYNLILVKVCILLKSLMELSDHNMLY